MSYKPNPTFTRELAAIGLQRAAEAVADLADEYAKSEGAPWMPRQRGQAVELETRGRQVFMVNRDYAGHLIEWGSIRNEPYAPLRRAVRAAGLKFQEE